MNLPFALIAMLLSDPGDASSDTLSHVVTLPPVVVNTSRANDRSPLAHSTLSREQLRQLNWGLDTPMALATQPGAYAYSDAGNGIGYSYLSIRGFPQRRISVLVNGVPLNDPESHEVYWIDHPDLLASTSEVQVQRGVGPALYGAAALGGSVNVETGPMSPAPGFTAAMSGGSFGTRHALLEGTSGELAGGWHLYGRYSRIETDGYRDQSWSKLWSYALSAQRASATQSWRVNLYGGPENTHLAYLGIPYANRDDHLVELDSPDRRANPLTYPGEQDHFFEPHYELIHSWAPRAGLTLSQTLFWFDGAGYYDERRADQALADYRLSPWATYDSTLFAPSAYARDSLGNLVVDGQGRVTVERADVVRRREITDRHFGWVPRARIEHARGALTLGGELRFHDGHHVGSVISGDGLPPGTAPDVRYYDYHPRTLSAGLFAREEWDARPSLRFMADLAWRHQSYDMRDDRFDGIAFEQAYDFALPRLAVTWSANERWSAFASYALASREPALRDLFDGEGAGGVPLLRAGEPLIRPEHVRDAELGTTWRGERASLTANLFRMDFRDELVYAGQFNTDLGYPVLGNAAKSVHQGVELAGRVSRAPGVLRVELDGNATLCDNHFVDYREHYGPTPADDAVYDGKALGFFPATMANAGARLGWRAFTLGADARYTGRIYVDNTEQRAFSIPPHSTLDLSLAATRHVGASSVEASVRVFNATDLRYATGGYDDYDAVGDLVPTLTPAATRSWLAGVRMSW